MQALICTARNISHIVRDDGEAKKLESCIEAVLTTYEKEMDFVGGGIVNTERTKTTRFAMTPEGARNFAESLNRWADEADAESEALTYVEAD